MTVDTRVQAWPEVVVKTPTCRRCGRHLHTSQEIEVALCRQCQEEMVWQEREQAERETIADLRAGLHW